MQLLHILSAFFFASSVRACPSYPYNPYIIGDCLSLPVWNETDQWPDYFLDDNQIDNITTDMVIPGVSSNVIVSMMKETNMTLDHNLFIVMVGTYDCIKNVSVDQYYDNIIFIRDSILSVNKNAFVMLVIPPKNEVCDILPYKEVVYDIMKLDPKPYVYLVDLVDLQYYNSQDISPDGIHLTSKGNFNIYNKMVDVMSTFTCPI